MARGGAAPREGGAPRDDAPFGGCRPGDRLGPIEIEVSEAANRRYWEAAGVDHPLLRAGALYPPIAANLATLLFQTVAPRPLLHTGQRLVSHRRADAPARLRVTGGVSARDARRGREYATVDAEIHLEDGDLLWTSIATFCEAGR